MIAKNLLLSTGIALSAVVGVSGAAQAASFTTNLGAGSNPPKGNVFLQSIEQNGQTFTYGTNLFQVTSVDIISNTGVSAFSAGGAGADAGDNATKPSPNRDNLGTDTASDVKATQYLGNNNLNNIIDTEDNGAFDINVFFGDEGVGRSSEGFDNLFFYERGKNSKIRVQALDVDGNLIGTAFTITEDLWGDAGYSIDTLEITGAQEVGSYGVSFDQLGLDDSVNRIYGLKLTALNGTGDNAFNGPDFKVFAGTYVAGTVPEPTTILGLGSVAALALVRRRRLKKVSSL
ncbi:exosortase-dependent surface protein XDP2 [Anabaena azotica]|uniref:PEP-CTERM sorting domain-containing protein n=1 Tax=Anabaena azotica FACHB-119 TaxID=947527 RepID=A0ABR8D4A2_9NOST|nr:exosortase-dependent surface protein XDP2 [Anabaena azotica]MBD2501975.1 PEP-CTERM sorting domain-containing protein [Anabaena azotica FACHB-119]